jgi:Tol biopolymer transport system component
MKRLLLLLACLAVTVTVTVARSASPADEQFEQAWLAWDAGDYVPALEGFKTVLQQPGGEAYFDRIAVITGELYRVTELTRDGAQPRLGPDGRYASYETGSPAVTKIVETAAPNRVVAQIEASGVVFAPAGDRIAYLRLRPDAELTKVRADLAQLQAAATPDRQKLGELQRTIARLSARLAEITVRDLASGREQNLPDGGMLKSSLAWSGDGREVYFVGTPDDEAAKGNDIYATSPSLSQPRALTSGVVGFKASPVVAPGGRFMVYGVSSGSPFPASGGRGGAGGGGARFGGRGGAGREFALVSLADGVTRRFTGSSADFSADGSTLVFVSQSGTESTIQVLKPGTGADPSVIKKSSLRIASASISPDGSLVAFDTPWMATKDTEIFTIRVDGTGETRVSREIQPDRNPRFLTNTTLVAIKGEPRHSRSYLYDLAAGRNFRLFHNNTVRTVAPEYEWVPGADGRRMLVVADRDGDTISPGRGVYLIDIGQKISRQELLDRIDKNLAAERDLRRRGAAMFQPIAAKVKAAVSKVSITKLYEYQAALFAFDIKAIGQPGNQKAAEYIFDTLKGFGYAPEYETFTTRDRTGGGDIETSNVLATLKGTTNPDTVYVLSAHYDSVPRGPGADDNTTGIAVLLEVARVMSKQPAPATIIFAAFTGEEAGDLGSHEFVRDRGKSLKLAAVINNDMIGWTNDHRLDDTIRYSNDSLRDLQHAAAFLFSNLITYDARYYRSTDAAAFYDVYGPITAGLGSYPILGNPYYHQPTDLLETVNQQLVFEAAKMNVATMMALGSGLVPAEKK